MRVEGDAAPPSVGSVVTGVMDHVPSDGDVIRALGRNRRPRAVCEPTVGYHHMVASAVDLDALGRLVGAVEAQVLEAQVVDVIPDLEDGRPHHLCAAAGPSEERSSAMGPVDDRSAATAGPVEVDLPANAVPPRPQTYHRAGNGPVASGSQ